MDSRTVEDLKELVHDKRRLSARCFAAIADTVGIDVEQTAVTLASLFSLYLLLGAAAASLANFFLFSLAFVCYVFPDETSSNISQIHLFTGLFAVSTLLDSRLENVLPAYYLIKVVLHLLLFLRPYCLAEKILQAMHAGQGKQLADKAHEEQHKADSVLSRMFSQNELNVLLNPHRKSPPPEKPADHNEEQEKNSVAPSGTASAATSPWPSSSAMQSVIPSPLTETAKHLATPIAAEETASLVDKDEDPKKREARKQNEMLAGESNFALSSASSATTAAMPFSLSSPSTLGHVNAYDLEFHPRSQIVFNAPFNLGNLTYHMKVKNVSRRRIAFALKSNGLPRVTAFPFAGVIQPGQTLEIAVTIQSFEESPDIFPRDRISFEYVRCETDSFSHSLLQAAGMKQRKNISIRYNE